MTTIRIAGSTPKQGTNPHQTIQNGSITLGGPNTSRDFNFQVRDPSGAAVPGAIVVLKNTEGKVIKTAVSDENGDVSLKGVKSAFYNVEVHSFGFKTLSGLHPFSNKTIEAMNLSKPIREKSDRIEHIVGFITQKTSFAKEKISDVELKALFEEFLNTKGALTPAKKGNFEELWSEKLAGAKLTRKATEYLNEIKMQFELAIY